MSQTHLKLVADMPNDDTSVRLKNLQVRFGDTRIIKNVTLDIPAKGVTCLVGPSGSGKSTILRSLNRINDTVDGCEMSGQVQINGLCSETDFPDVTQLRAKIGMVFQKPCVFPCSIKDNVLFGVRDRKMSKLDRIALVEASLKDAALWKEVEHRLDSPAHTLSLGQQQRLCIARSLAVKPDILLLDEPTASVDPVSARALENLIVSLKDKYTIIMVTHDIRQTRRIADHVIFLCEGEVIENGSVAHMFSETVLPKTRTYLSEEFCDC